MFRGCSCKPCNFDLESRVLNLNLSAIKRLEDLARKQADCVSLSQGCLRIDGIPPLIKDHVAELMATDRTDYYENAWGIDALRSKLAAHLSDKYSTSLVSNNILVTHGSIGALSALIISLTDPGDDILLPEPTYPAYMTLTALARCRPMFLACMGNGADADTWQIDVKELERKITDKTKLVVFSNPCNPTGALVDKATIKELINVCERRGVYLVIDEVYDDYIFDDRDFTSLTSYVTSSPFLIRTGSFSKNFAMSGWRVGYLVASPELVNLCARTQDALLNCVNVPAQHAALFALDHPELVEPFKQIVGHNRAIVEQALKPLMGNGLIYYTTPAAGFNYFVNACGLNTFEFSESALRDANVAVVPGRAFGPSGEAYFRVCYARKTAIVEEGIKRLTDYLLSKPTDTSKAPRAHCS